MITVSRLINFLLMGLSNYQNTHSNQVDNIHLLDLLLTLRNAKTSKDILYSLESCFYLFSLKSISYINHSALISDSTQPMVLGYNVDPSDLKCIQNSDNFNENPNLIKLKKTFSNTVIVKNKEQFSTVPIVNKNTVIFTNFKNYNKKYSLLFVDFTKNKSMDNEVLATLSKVLPFLHQAASIVKCKDGFMLSYELTKKEQDILLLITRGLNNKEITREMNCSERTAKYHITQLMKKTNTSSRLELAINAIHSVRL